MDTRTSPLSFDLPDDPITLREMVVSLSSEKSVLEAEKKSLEIEKDRLKRHAEYLQGQLNILIAKRFARSSEKYE
ncbi:MAG: hypothetical protein HQL90_04725, partial [Magnetococcales bacterium]|nr:hypothetical protein [Magnetococcales bacterium]